MLAKQNQPGEIILFQVDSGCRLGGLSSVQLKMWKCISTEVEFPSVAV